MQLSYSVDGPSVFLNVTSGVVDNAPPVTPACSGLANGGGGSFTMRDIYCHAVNPKTGGCSCPAGFTAYSSGIIGNVDPGWVQLYFCTK